MFAAQEIPKGTNFPMIPDPSKQKGLVVTENMSLCIKFMDQYTINLEKGGGRGVQTDCNKVTCTSDYLVQAILAGNTAVFRGTYTPPADLKEHPMFYVNASAAPNCEFVQRRGKVYVNTTQEIQPGEELTVGYKQYCPLISDKIMLEEAKENERMQLLRKFSRTLSQYSTDRVVEIKSNLRAEMTALLHLVEHKNIPVYGNVVAMFLRIAGLPVRKNISCLTTSHRYVVFDGEQKWIGVQDTLTGATRFIFALHAPYYDIESTTHAIECKYLIATRYDELGRFGYGHKTWRTLKADPVVKHIEKQLVPAISAWRAFRPYCSKNNFLTVERVTRKYRLNKKKRQASSHQTRPPANGPVVRYDRMEGVRHMHSST